MLQNRFIPTGVGNTSGRFLMRTIIAVHPHGCGEHIMRLLRVSVSIGSSPRVWGTYSIMYIKSASQRFIPTGVGNITIQLFIFMKPTVHPHGCGEHRASRANGEL